MFEGTPQSSYIILVIIEHTCGQRLLIMYHLRRPRDITRGARPVRATRWRRRPRSSTRMGSMFFFTPRVWEPSKRVEACVVEVRREQDAAGNHERVAVSICYICVVGLGLCQPDMIFFLVLSQSPFNAYYVLVACWISSSTSSRTVAALHRQLYRDFRWSTVLYNTRFLYQRGISTVGNCGSHSWVLAYNGPPGVCGFSLAICVRLHRIKRARLFMELLLSDLCCCCFVVSRT